MRGKDRPKQVGIKDIAKQLGVSIGTVDRALHGRPGINAGTRAKVLRTAEELGYRPNLAARFLRSGKHYRVSVHLPAEIASFYDALREGIREGARPLESTLALDFRTHPRLGAGEVELFEHALEEGVSGIILAPGRPAELKRLITKAAARGTAVVCVSTDAPETDRLTTISNDPYTGGAMVGELFCLLTRGSGKLAFMTGDLSAVDHSEKLRGFASSLRTMGQGVSMAAVLESHSNPAEAYEQARTLLSQHPDLQGIYVSTANSIPVLRALEEAGAGIQVITTDFFPELVEPIRTGRVLATIHQRPFAQGKLAVEALCQYLMEGVRPPQRIKLAPHVVMKSNLDLFLENSGFEPELVGI